MTSLEDKYKYLSFDRNGNILTVIMDNPPLNAAAYDLHQELSHIFYDLADDPCRIVILTGNGRAFSAGGDFEDMLRNCDETDRQARLLQRAPHIFHSMLALEKPLIAKVNGHAMGLGATLALLCDVAFMVDKARIADPHVQIGMSAGDGGAILWPLLIGFAKARHYLLTGEAITGAQAEEIGLIYKAVAPDDLEETVSEYAKKLLSIAPKALTATKRSINMVLQKLSVGLVESHVGLEQISMNSPDHREALTAIMEKRDPVFTGK